NALGTSMAGVGWGGAGGRSAAGGPKNTWWMSRSEYATLNIPASVAIAGSATRTAGPPPANTVSAKNISFDKNPLSSGTPAIAAAATVASVAVIGSACPRPP